jgi:hypothetical protein
MISDKQRYIYNTHLAVSRKSKNLPFRKRIDFDKLDEDKKSSLIKLERMFSSYPEINMETFFESPYKHYNDVEYFDLKYYTTNKAKKDYTQHIQQLELLSPDNEESLKRVVSGLNFVKNFCKERGLTLSDYHSYSEKNIPSVLEHLKKHHINYYVIHSLGITKIPIENRILDFMFNDFWQTFRKTKNMFYSSYKMKDLTKRAIKKIEIKLNDQYGNNV